MNYVYTKVELRSSSLHFAITELMKLAIGAPTPEKVKKILAIYEDPNHHLLGCFYEDNLIGLVGIQTKETHGIIKHIAVLNPYQKQGIGETLIIEVISCWKLVTCEAETDAKGKGFYEKTGFTCNSFKGSYNMRYKCQWKRRP